MPWQELVIEAEADDLDAFVAVADVAVLRGDDLDLERSSLLHRLCDLLDLPHHHLLFAAPEAAEEIVHRIADHPRLELKRRFTVDRASFPFEAKAWSEEAAQRIRAAIHADMPAGVTLSGLTEATSRDPLAHGTELYSPVHGFEYQAGGRVEGDLRGVAEVHRRLDDLDFVDTEKIELTVQELPLRQAEEAPGE